jgi:MFS transporter, SHS family, lactate transporter
LFPPALISLLVRSRVRESEVWERNVRLNRTPPSKVLRDPAVLKRFVYLVLLMSAFNLMSHGTQDVYPTFLKTGLGLASHTALYIAMIYNVGAILGAAILGGYSERLGRRRTIMWAAGVGILIVPFFALSTATGWLAVSSFLMQFCVQGAWGVIPAHLTELSPDSIRGFYPGVTYQLGILIAALNLPLQEYLAAGHGYPAALMSTVFPSLVLTVLLVAVGKEAKGVTFGTAETATMLPSPATGEGALRPGGALEGPLGL